MNQSRPHTTKDLCYRGAVTTDRAPSLVLYGNSMWTSPYVLSCFVGLTEKRLPFQMPERLRAFAQREWQRPSVAAFVSASRPPHRPAAA